MRLSAMCIRCLVERQEERIRHIEDENKKAAYLKEVASIIASSSEDASAPYLIHRINIIYKKYFGEFQNFEKEKAEYNKLMMELEKDMEQDIRKGKDNTEILRNALNLARTANYIDFGTGNHVKKEELIKLLGDAKKESLDEKTFLNFRRDLEVAKELVYLTDNCGEIVADKLLIKIIGEQYPDIKVTVIVRGMPVINDATVKDAETTGLTKVAAVLDNGNGVAGTQLTMLADKARHALGRADLIISKGQGNFETIHDCGLNIYYLFLCKCQWFTTRFGMEKLKGVFVNERDIFAK